MNILAIETSFQKASIAIHAGNNLAAFCHDDAINMQAENLFPLIDKAFVASKLQYSDLKYIAVTNGPGSFTGIRIGLSAVKGIMLAAPHLCSVVLSNFEVMGFMAMKQLSSQVKYIIVILQATPSSIYIQTFNFDLSYCLDPEIIHIDQINNYLSRYDNTISAIIGNAIDLVLDKIIDITNLIILPRFSKVDARLLMFLTRYKLQNAKSVSKEIEPLYIKPASVNVVY
jgi:tRNA threonylcarbamoyladenosine biosynthesis protein TsaB